jgi:hypothetical protein
MSALFSSPKTAVMPAGPTPAPAPPTLDQAALNQQNDKLIRSRRGAAASVLAGTNPAAPMTLGTPKLLGG